MKTSPRTVVLSALFLALTMMMMYAGSLIPAARMAVVAAASLLTIATVIELGLGPAVLVFVGGAVLGTVLIPDKTTPLLYAVFFGFYPIVKSLAERIKPPLLEWTVKIVAFNASLSAVWFLFRRLVFNDDILAMASGFTVFATILAYLGGNAVFIVFDIGLTRLIGLYIVRISRHTKKKDR